MAGLIINSPFERPNYHLEPTAGGKFKAVEGRRSAGYEIFDTRNNTKRTETLDLVNTIRSRVDAWRDADYPGVTTVTRSLLEHWRDPAAGVREYPFYFCQLEAVETLIWWVEAPAEHKQGINIPGDGGEWERLCNKMATGTGKTIVMAMIVTWQVLNAVQYPRRNRDFSKAVLVVTPGLTVKERLRVLGTGEPDNVYDAFNLCPNESARQRLNQLELLVENWHTLMPLKDQDRSVVKKGKESDEAFTRRVLGKLAAFKDLVVINDEAHHAYRIRAADKRSRELKAYAEEAGLDLEEATRWIEGLDRIHKTRRIQRCFDLTATPFAPTGMSNTEKGLFGWIVSDFGLNDAIEAGLVKTPRVVVRDDALPNAQTYRSKLYHLYNEDEVKDDLNRRAQPHEPLPQLVQNAYTLLGADWDAARKDWEKAGFYAPPVMLTVCNRIETSKRIEHYFNQGDAHWPALHVPTRTLRVDSKVLGKAEVGEAAASDKDYEKTLRDIVEASELSGSLRANLDGMKKEELLREIVDNVGKRGTAGQQLQNVISVAMLSEGWDAKNVTHIMGLRAFTSQLLCEQVIGRGLRRVGFEREKQICPDGVERELFKPEYVNVFGVPLSVFESEESGEPPPPPKPSTQIEVIPERNGLEIRWPNVVRVEVTVRPVLEVDWERVEPLTIDPKNTAINADLAPALGSGATDFSQIEQIDLEKLPDDFRLQRLLFKAARKAFEDLRGVYKGNPEYLVAQLIRLMERFLDSGKVVIPSMYHQDELRKRILLALNVDLLVQHLLRFVREQNHERFEPIFDEERPIGSTAYMRTWYSTKPNQQTVRSHISHVVYDSTWEKFAADALERDKRVESYAKNDHLNFHIYYMWNGARRRFVPDFVIRFTNGKTLVLEIKGEDDAQNKAKRAALDVWVQAINGKGGFGVWAWDVAFDPNDINGILAKHGAALSKET